MAEEVQEEKEPQQVPKGQAHIDAQCVCGKPIQLKLPMQSIMNGQIVSSLTLIHLQNTCEACGQQFLALVQDVKGIQYSFMPLKRHDDINAEKPRIITAPANALGNLQMPGSRRRSNLKQTLKKTTLVKKAENASIIDIQDNLRELIEAIHQAGGKTLEPLAPYVLLYTLPKGLMEGLIVLPDQKNKPVAEGIVVKTFKPYVDTSKCYFDNEGEKHILEVEVSPTVKVGDHVLFNHFAGVPVPFLNPGGLHSGLSSHGDFRLVRNDDNQDLGCILGVLDYESKSTFNKVTEAFGSAMDLKKKDREKLTTFLMHYFLIIDREMTGKTSSGASNYDSIKAGK